jgi:hypothetical protein
MLGIAAGLRLGYIEAAVLFDGALCRADARSNNSRSGISVTLRVSYGTRTTFSNVLDSRHSEENLYRNRSVASKVRRYIHLQVCKREVVKRTEGGCSAGEPPKQIAGLLTPQNQTREEQYWDFPRLHYPQE